MKSMKRKGRDGREEMGAVCRHFTSSTPKRT